MRGSQSWRVAFLILCIESTTCLVSLSNIFRRYVLMDNEFCTLYNIHDMSDDDSSKFLGFLPSNDSTQSNNKNSYSLTKSKSNGRLAAIPFVGTREEKLQKLVSEKQQHTLCFLLLVHDAPTSRQETIEQDDENINVGTRLLWTDENVNIWEFVLQPNQSCPYHVHRHAYFFINLQVSLTQALQRNGLPDQTTPRMQQENQITLVRKQDLTGHGVHNVGKDTFQQFILEFKKS